MAAGPGTLRRAGWGRRVRKRGNRDAARRDAGSAAGPSKAKGGAASGEPGKIPSRAIEMAGLGSRSRALAETRPRKNATAPRAGPKAPTRSSSGPPRTQKHHVSLQPGCQKGGGTRSTGAAPPRREEDVQEVERWGLVVDARAARAPTGSPARVIEPLGDSTHGRQDAPRRQSPGLGPISLSGYPRTAGGCRPASEPRS